jgi:hypothetical protein
LVGLKWVGDNISRLQAHKIQPFESRMASRRAAVPPGTIVCIGKDRYMRKEATVLLWPLVGQTSNGQFGRWYLATAGFTLPLSYQNPVTKKA